MLLPKLAAEEDPAELRRKVCPADFYFEFNFYCRRIFVLKKNANHGNRQRSTWILTIWLVSNFFCRHYGL